MYPVASQSRLGGYRGLPISRLLRHAGLTVGLNSFLGCNKRACQQPPPNHAGGEIWEISQMTEVTSYYCGGEGLVKVLAIMSMY
jgi:hypothetical protein